MIYRKGIALIQVLIITAILSVFALYLNQTAKQQIHLASLAQKRAEAEALLYSAHSKLLFELLTTDKLLYNSEQPIDTSSNKASHRWNFHGQPFNINDFVTIKIQDQAGLLNLHKPNIDLLEQFLISNNIGLTRARIIIDSLLDWQDKDSITREFGRDSVDLNSVRNGPLNDLEELEKVVLLSDEEKKLLFDNTTVSFIGHFNPMSASKELIKSITKNVGSERIIERLRNENALSRGKFEDITGIHDNDNTWLTVSNTLRITYQVEYDSINLKKEFVIKFKPYATGKVSPYTILSERN